MTLPSIARKILASIRNKSQFTVLDGKSLANFISFVAGIALVLVAGPNLQTFALGTVASKEASIYEAAYQEAIYPGISASTWFASALWPPIILAAAFICLMALRNKRARPIFTMASFAGFLSWTVIDFSHLALTEWSTEVFLQCVLANLFGGVLIGGILLLFIYAQMRTVRFLKHSRTISAAAGVLTPISLGFLVSGSALVAYNLFYQVTPSDINLRLRLPVQATHEVIENGANRQAFGVLRSPKRLKSDAKWIGVGSNATFRWANESSAEHLVSIHVFEGCVTEDAIRRLLSGKPTLEKMVLTNVGLTMSDGLIDARILNTSGSAGEIAFSGDRLRRFRVGELNDRGKVETTLMPSDEGIIRHVNSGEVSHYYLAALLMGDDSRESRQSTEEISIDLLPREITFTLGDTTRTILFSPPNQFERKAPIECNLIELSDDFAAWPPSVQIGELAVGAIITIEPSSALWSPRDRTAVSAEIEGIAGWISIESDNYSELADKIDSGGTETLIARGILESGKVDADLLGESQDFSVQARGDLYLYASNEGILSISGEATALYLDGRRKTQTRWEKLDWQARLLVFGALPTLFAYLFSITRSLLGSNRRMQP